MPIASIDLNVNRLYVINNNVYWFSPHNDLGLNRTL